MRKLDSRELDRKSIEEFKGARKTPLILILDNVRSLHNVGAVFRTADAFLLEGVYLCGITGTPPNREITKTALGATETINWKHYVETSSAVTELKEKGYAVFALEHTDKSLPLDEFKFPKGQGIAVVLGNEVNGVDQLVIDLCDSAIEIPQAGSKHSLNVSVACGILVWEVYKKMRK